jgi:serine/threonine protein kinase
MATYFLIVEDRRPRCSELICGYNARVNAPDDHGTKVPPSAGSDDLPQQTQPLPARAREAAAGAEASSQLIGDILAARYRIVRRLGSGGMGEVFEAEDLELHARIALKTIRSDIALQPDALERFKREVHLARKVTHPNVCRIFDLGCYTASSGAKSWFLTMELLAGPTLAQTIAQSGRMTVADALPIVYRLVRNLNLKLDFMKFLGERAGRKPE